MTQSLMAVYKKNSTLRWAIDLTSAPYVSPRPQEGIFTSKRRGVGRAA